MPVVNLLQLGTQGVDMKSNPLLLGNKKLHAATNMVFEEGVIRTRPGFIYTRTGASGQFQGASEFDLSKGISAGRFGDSFGLAVVAGGSLTIDGVTVDGLDFTSRGPVHLFQAENYLVIQNESSSTYWWNGTDITQSPGMVEQDWHDIEPPQWDNSFTPPEIGEIPVSGRTKISKLIGLKINTGFYAEEYDLYANGVKLAHIVPNDDPDYPDWTVTLNESKASAISNTLINSDEIVFEMRNPVPGWNASPTSYYVLDSSGEVIIQGNFELDTFTLLYSEIP